MQFLRPWHYDRRIQVQQAFDISEEEKVFMQKWKNATDEAVHSTQATLF